MLPEFWRLFPTFILALATSQSQSQANAQGDADHNEGSAATRYLLQANSSSNLPQFWGEFNKEGFFTVTCQGENVVALTGTTCRIMSDCRNCPTHSETCSDKRGQLQGVNSTCPADSNSGRTGENCVTVTLRDIDGSLSSRMVAGHFSCTYGSYKKIFYEHFKTPRKIDPLQTEGGISLEIFQGDSAITAKLSSTPNRHNENENIAETKSDVKVDLLTGERAFVQCRIDKTKFTRPLSPIKLLLTNSDSPLDLGHVTARSTADPGDFWNFTVNGLRVTKNVTGFLCSAQPLTQPSVVVHKVIRVNVKDPESGPFNLTTSSPDANAILNDGGKVGCVLEDRLEKQNQSQIVFQVLQEYNVGVFGRGPQNVTISSRVEFSRFQWLAENMSVDYNCSVAFSDVKKAIIVHLASPLAPNIEKTKSSDPTHSNLNIISNETTTLQCQFNGEPEPSVLWLRNGKPFYYASAERTGNKNGNQTGQSSYLSSIEIPKPLFSLSRYEDVYPNFTCIVSNYLGVAQQEFVTNTPPKIRQVLQDHDHDHANDSISCIFTGGPNTELKWLHNELELNDSEARVTFRNGPNVGESTVTLKLLKLHEDSGSNSSRTANGSKIEGSENYTCQVKNYWGKDERQFEVSVKEMANDNLNKSNTSSNNPDTSNTTPNSNLDASNTTSTNKSLDTTNSKSDTLIEKDHKVKDEGVSKGSVILIGIAVLLFVVLIGIIVIQYRKIKKLNTRYATRVASSYEKVSVDENGRRKRNPPNSSFIPMATELRTISQTQTPLLAPRSPPLETCPEDVELLLDKNLRSQSSPSHPQISQRSKPTVLPLPPLNQFLDNLDNSTENDSSSTSTFGNNSK